MHLMWINHLTLFVFVFLFPQRDRMQLRRLSEKFDRDLQADAQRRKGVRRMLLLGPPGAGKRQFLNLLARAIHAGKLPGLHLLQFSGLKQKVWRSFVPNFKLNVFAKCLSSCF